MTIVYVQQPEKSRLCGQHCLAMVTGKTVSEIIELAKTEKGTTTKNIVSVLNTLGIENSGKLVSRRNQPMPEFAICKVRREWNKSGNWHWVVYSNGNIYDPNPSETNGIREIMSIEEYDTVLKTINQRLSSYISIKK